MTQRLVSFQPTPRADQQLESVIETIADFGRGHRLHPGRRQFDRQRDTVEPIDKPPLTAVDCIQASRSGHVRQQVRRPQSISSEGTRHDRSSARPSPSRLVARIFTVVDCASIASIRSAAASTTCSQLSKTRSRTRPSSAAAIGLADGLAWLLRDTQGRRRPRRGPRPDRSPLRVRKSIRHQGIQSASLYRDFQRQPRLADAADTGQRDQTVLSVGRLRYR